MINLTTKPHLNIMLNNTNKALAHVVNAASSSELKELSQFKDLKSIMNSVLNEASKDTSSNKTLLNLVKNNPTLKNLGATTQTINDILTTLKAEKNPLPSEKILQKFLVDIKEVKDTILKEKIQNSGLFLESKIKNIEKPQVELKATLSSLSKLLEKSDIFNVKVLGEQLKENDIKKFQNILPKLQEHIQNADTLNKPKLNATLTKLEHLIEPTMLTKENFNQKQIQQTLSNLSTELTQSANPNTKSVLDSLSKIFALLKNTPSLDSFTQSAIPQEIKTQLENLKSLITKGDIVFSKEVSQHISKLSTHNPDPIKELLNNDLKAILHTTKEELSKQEQAKTELIKHIDKLALQIDHAQLLSHLSNATSLYLPFSWDAMKEGKITIQKENNKKFNVEIDLNLKEYGALNLKLSIFEKNQLNLHIYTQNQDLQNLIKENIKELRSNLISQQITPREIRLFNKAQTQPTSAYETTNQDLYMGFEVKA